MDRYVVFGNPIGHSKSPAIHRLFAEQTGQTMEYGARLAPLDDFAGNAREFFQDGLGANVTLPFKEDAFRLCSVLTPRAERAGAVNMLTRLPDGTLRGDNTDGVGLVRDLINNAGVTLAGKRILLLGAGGAVRGVVESLLEQKPVSLVIANRTVDKAELLAQIFAGLGPVAASGFDWLEEPVDIIINATSASLAGDLPPISSSLIQPGVTVCYDMMYGKEPTPFCRWAAEHGAAQALDGFGMLVEQAAEAFTYWRGVTPDSKAVMATLRQEMAAG
ncbi:shikimate dehydrogenase [Pseudomonas putida]